MNIKLHFKRALCAFALFATSAVSVLAQFPANTAWDVVINGNYTGNALLVFNDDFTNGVGTLVGYQIVTANIKGKSDPDDIDRGGSDTGRLPGDSGGINSPTVTKRLDGSSLLSGTWTTNRQGKIIGTYTASSTNVTATSTNSASNLVNAVSFVARVKPSKLSMSASSTHGNFTLKGVPYEPLPSIEGSWSANGEKSGQPFIELFKLAPTSLTNLYDYMGWGPNYTNSGTALLSAQKRLSIVTINSDTNDVVIRTLSGSFKSNNKGTSAILRGSQVGGDSDSTNSTRAKILFRATKQ